VNQLKVAFNVPCDKCGRHYFFDQARSKGQKEEYQPMDLPGESLDTVMKLVREAKEVYLKKK
jgi:hypothetical protein